MDIPVHEQRAVVQIREATNLDNVSVVSTFLTDACAVLGFNILLGPSVIYHKDKDREKSGVSGVVVFSESSMSFHSWPEKSYAAIDIYSCIEFNPKTLLRVIKHYFEPMEYKIRELLLDG